MLMCYKTENIMNGNQGVYSQNHKSYCSKYEFSWQNYGQNNKYFNQNRENKVYGFLPLYADKYDLNKLNKFMDYQIPIECTDEIEQIFSDKVKLSKGSVIQVISQIKERELIKKRSTRMIDYSIDKCRTKILGVNGFYTGNFVYGEDKTINDLEKEVLKLEKEKRDAETSCWRDLSQLRKDLLFIMSEYKTNARKKELIAC